MSVATQLGLDEPSAVLRAADHKWADWTTEYSHLPEYRAELRAWLSAASPDEADRVLHSLATLAATDGGDDLAAASVLAWGLLPGACTLAHRLRTLSPRIDEIVAAQLWVEVRTFPWNRLRKVAANILLNTRAGVLRECGTAGHVARIDPTWSRTYIFDPDGPFWATQFHPENTSATTELHEIMDWACAQAIISDTDRKLLLRLAAAADETPTNRTGRGHAGLMANQPAAQVGAQLGLSATTIRRRARHSIRALALACADGTP